MVPRKLLERISQEGNLLGMRMHHVHEGLHDGVANRGGLTRAAIVDQMILGKILLQKLLNTLTVPCKKTNPETDGSKIFLTPFFSASFL